MIDQGIGTPDDAEYQAWLAKRRQASPGPQAPKPSTHDDAEFQAWKAQQQNNTPPASAGPRSTLYNVLNTIDNTLTAGLGQKFNAAFNAAGDALRGRDSFTHSYTTNLDAEHQGLAKLKEQHPYGAAALGAGGAAAQVALAAPFAAAGEVANGLGLGARTAAAARTGGALGAVNALGNAPNRGSALDQVATGAKGGALGAAVGAAVVPATQAIGAGARMIGQKLANATSDAASAAAPTTVTPKAAQLLGVDATNRQSIDPATRLILKRLERTGLTPQEALDRLGAIAGDKPVSIMEVAGDQSHPLRQLGKWVARTPSTGASQLRSAIATRAEPLTNAQRVLGDVGEALGVNRTNLVENAQSLKGQQLGNAQKFYDQAFGDQTPQVPVTAKVGDGPSLAELLKRPSIKNAVKFHNEIAAERGEAPIELGKVGADSEGEQVYKTMIGQGINPEKARAFVDAEYGAAPAETMPLKTLQQLKFKLDDALGFAKTRGTLPDGTPATNAKLGAINDTRKALLEIMKAHSPEYAQGNAQWAGDAAVQDAGEQGREFLSRDINELQQAIPAMSAGERTQHNVSALSGPIRNRVFNTSAVDRAKIFSNPDIQERLQTVVPGSRLDALRKSLGVEHQIALTNQGVVGGSDTAENLLNDADASGQVAKSLLSGLTMGRTRRVLGTAARGAISPIVDKVIRGINENSANALAPKLMAGMQSRQDLESFLNELATALDQIQKTRGSLPYAGTMAGAAVNQTPIMQRR